MRDETGVRQSLGYQLLKDDPAPTSENVARWMTLLNDVAAELSKRLGTAVHIDEAVLRAAIAVWRKRGLPYCPCRPMIASPAFVCPCIEVEDADALLKRGGCTCGLFRVGKV